jgi:hypothetical protein
MIEAQPPTTHWTLRDRLVPLQKVTPRPKDGLPLVWTRR